MGKHSVLHLAYGIQQVIEATSAAQIRIFIYNREINLLGDGLGDQVVEAPRVVVRKSSVGASA